MYAHIGRPNSSAIFINIPRVGGRYSCQSIRNKDKVHSNIRMWSILIIICIQLYTYYFASILRCCIYLSSIIYIIQVSLSCMQTMHMWPYSSDCRRAAAASLCSSPTCCVSPLRRCSQFFAAENARSAYFGWQMRSRDFLSTQRYFSLGKHTLSYIVHNISQYPTSIVLVQWTDIELPSYVALIPVKSWIIWTPACSRRKHPNNWYNQ